MNGLPLNVKSYNCTVNHHAYRMACLALRGSTHRHAFLIMKRFYLLIPVFSLFLINCSSTYKISSFSSKDKFYEDFNNFAINKTIKISLSNDSTFISNYAEIVNDTLYCKSKKNESISKKIALSDINKIRYSGSYFQQGVILLNNGETIDADDISIANDSLGYSYIHTFDTLICSISMNKIKNISYKNHWLGMPVPLITVPLIANSIVFIISQIARIDQNTTAGWLRK